MPQNGAPASWVAGPPYGFARAGVPSVLVEIPGRIARVRALYRRAAEGATDRELAVEFSFAKTHVAELLTNPIYVGRLRDGNRRPPIIDEALWAQVAEMRSRHSRRHPGPTRYRQYLWSGLIRCRACGRRLTGHVQRYRHVDACEAFRAARPGGTDPRHKGDSYRLGIYDAYLRSSYGSASAGLEDYCDCTGWSSVDPIVMGYFGLNGSRQVQSGYQMSLYTRSTGHWATWTDGRTSAGPPNDGLHMTELRDFYALEAW